MISRKIWCFGWNVPAKWSHILNILENRSLIRDCGIQFPRSLLKCPLSIVTFLLQWNHTFQFLYNHQIGNAAVNPGSCLWSGSVFALMLWLKYWLPCCMTMTFLRTDIQQCIQEVKISRIPPGDSLVPVDTANESLKLQQWIAHPWTRYCLVYNTTELVGTVGTGHSI